jgi:hypothetical protein
LTGKRRKERRAYLGHDLVYNLQLVGRGSEMLLLLLQVPAPHAS